MIKPRDVVAAISYKFEGNWNQIYDCLIQRSDYHDCDIENLLKEIKTNYITILDPEYPEILKKGYQPPFTLFYHGDISLLQDTCEKAISIVGTREPTDYGIKLTSKIAEELAKHYTIISGMALGIDALAHHGAIKGGGKTIAVLGCGINYCYPSDNILLYNKLKKDHLIISEFPNETPPTKDKFRFRNRIVAFLSKATIITEAHGFSGSSITAGLAAEIGKPVLCFPDQAGKDSCCNRLIKEGATLVESADDILFELKSNTGENVENF